MEIVCFCKCYCFSEKSTTPKHVVPMISYPISYVLCHWVLSFPYVHNFLVLRKDWVSSLKHGFCVMCFGNVMVAYNSLLVNCPSVVHMTVDSKNWHFQTLSPLKWKSLREAQFPWACFDFCSWFLQPCVGWIGGGAMEKSRKIIFYKIFVFSLRMVLSCY